MLPIFLYNKNRCKTHSLHRFIIFSCFRKTGVSHIFHKPQKYAIIESKKVLKKQHLKSEEKCGKSDMIKKPTECEPKNVPSHKGTIVDATFVNAPRQRNSRDENKKSKTVRFLKNGKIPKTKVNSLRKIQTQTGQRRMVNCILGIRIM